LFKPLKSTFIKRPEVGQFDRMRRNVKLWERVRRVRGKRRVHHMAETVAW
jgi:hypothetical protein